MSLGPLDHDLNQSIRKQLRILGYTEHTVEWDGAMAAARAYAERRDAPPARVSSPQSAKPASAQGSPWAEGTGIESGRFTVDAKSWDGADLELTCGHCGWYANLGEDPTDLAELVRRAGEHTEVCR